MRVIPRTFLWQLSLSLIVAQTITVFIVGVFFIGRIETMHQNQTIDTLSKLVPIVLADIEEYGVTKQVDEIIKKQFGGSDYFRVTVIDKGGVVVADSMGVPSEMENHLQREEVQLALRDGDQGWATHRSRTLGVEMMYFAKHLPNIGFIRTSMDTSRVQEEITKTIELVIIVGSLLLLITIGTTLVISRIVTSNINTLVSGAERFASGDLEHRIETQSTNEFQQLAQSLNTMGTRLGTLVDNAENSKKEQDSILGSMPTGVIALDSNKNILSFNKATTKILTVPKSVDPRGRALEEFIRDVDLSGYIESVSLGDATRRFELVIFNPDGSSREVIASVQPLGDNQDDLVGYLVLLDDVTTLKRLEGIRSDFSANVSHELRTPITAIRGYVETLIDTIDCEATTKESLAIVLRNTTRLETIIEDLLSLARLEEELQTVTESVVVKELLERVASTCERELEKVNGTISIECEDELTIHASPQLLEQAVENLVQNAIRYGPDGGTVELRGSRREGAISVSVVDYGIGIPKDLQYRIFERFFRVDKGRSRGTGGTGLGLAIVKHVAKSHGGKVTVQSEVGVGSTFEIQIPAKP